MMRHRRVLNLYDTDTSHEDLLIYLEGIEGTTRQGQALLQMVLIGFRVTAMHESGEEAYSLVRNPDFAKALRSKRVPRTHVQRIPQRRTAAEDSLPSLVESESIVFDTTEVRNVAIDGQLLDAESSFVEPEEHHEDEYNTLKILRAADRGDK